MGQAERKFRRSEITGVNQAEIHPFADDALIAGGGWPDEFRRQFQRRIVVERGREAFFGELDTVPMHAGEANFALVPLRRNCLHRYCIARRLWWSDYGFGGEVEGDAEHIGVLDIKNIVFVEVVGLAAQRPADDLFAEQLCAEGANSEYMGDGVGIPALRQHGDGYDAAGIATEATGFPHGVHGLAQQLLIREVFGLTSVSRALDDLLPESCDFIARRSPEVFVQCVTGLQLLTVDEQRAWARERSAVLIEVAK